MGRWPMPCKADRVIRTSGGGGGGGVSNGADDAAHRASIMTQRKVSILCTVPLKEPVRTSVDGPEDLC